MNESVMGRQVIEIYSCVVESTAFRVSIRTLLADAKSGQPPQFHPLELD
jgi:hypothetical protein